MRPEAKALRERPHHRVLADQLGEGLRPVFAGKRGMALIGASGRDRAVGLHCFLVERFGALSC